MTRFRFGAVNTVRILTKGTVSHHQGDSVKPSTTAATYSATGTNRARWTMMNLPVLTMSPIGKTSKNCVLMHTCFAARSFSNRFRSMSCKRSFCQGSCIAIPAIDSTPYTIRYYFLRTASPKRLPNRARRPSYRQALPRCLRSGRLSGIGATHHFPSPRALTSSPAGRGTNWKSRDRLSPRSL